MTRLAAKGRGVHLTAILVGSTSADELYAHAATPRHVKPWAFNTNCSTVSEHRRKTSPRSYAVAQP